MVFNTLSGRFLGLTIVFVMIAEVLIFVPSIARFRQDYLQDRLELAQVAALALLATPDDSVAPDLGKELLASAGVLNVVLRRDEVRELVLDGEVPGPVAQTFYLREGRPDDHDAQRAQGLPPGARPDHPRGRPDATRRPWHRGGHAPRVAAAGCDDRSGPTHPLHLAGRLARHRGAAVPGGSTADRPADRAGGRPHDRLSRRPRGHEPDHHPRPRRPRVARGGDGAPRSRGAAHCRPEAEEPARRARRGGRQGQPRPAQHAHDRAAPGRPYRGEFGSGGPAHRAEARGVAFPGDQPLRADAHLWQGRGAAAATGGQHARAAGGRGPGERAGGARRGRVACASTPICRPTCGFEPIPTSCSGFCRISSATRRRRSRRRARADR